MAYGRRFQKVFDHIHQHLDEELSVDVLSRVANFSRFHFHRQFSQYAGIGVGRYVQLMRLKQASYRLVFEAEARIIDIALDAGFENPESFSRAFKTALGQTPTQFRKDPAWQPWSERFQLPALERNTPMEVRIVDFPETAIAVLEHRGAPALVYDTVQQFIAWRKATGLSPIATSRHFGIAYDDPAATPPEQFRFDLGGSVTAPVPANPQGVVNKRIPAGRCAVVRHIGSRDEANLGLSIYPLYRHWLPKSGEELRDFPLFFEYLNLVPQVQEHELITDIYLPLK
ncbi:MAG: helix-turn-helix domain-containing protein [Rhodocyclaceae bacterium]|nr:MAG: helix-turn-helix domain-containing protein [Rhodocyclaceae bacterium]